jgi:hypothetical protein
VNVEAIRTQRTVTAEKLEHLRGQLGGAVLDGTKPEKLQADIARAEADLAGYVEAEAEATRRERTADAEDAARHKARNQSDMAASLERYLVAVDTAQQATQNLVAALRDATFAAAEMRRCQGVIGGKARHELEGAGVVRALSNLVGEGLTAITGQTKFGTLQFTPLPSLNSKKVTDWRSFESKRMRPAVESFTKG